MESYDNINRTNQSRHRKLKTFIFFSAVIAVISIVLQYGVYANHKSGAWTPDYEMCDILSVLEKKNFSEEDYEILYAQTGLTKTAIDELVSAGKTEKILRIQKAFFTEYEWVNEPFAPFTCSDRLNEVIPLAELEDGDIIITPNSHFSFFKTGHVALVVDAANGRILNATGYGNKSGLEDITELSCRPGFLILRIKAEKEIRNAVVEYAKDNLTGLKYSLLSGIFEEDGKITKTQCSHLVWYAYNHFGIDLDSNGGLFVWPNDISNSTELEVVQVYGMDPEKLWK